MPDMVAMEESYETGSIGAGQGEWAPSTWATLFFVLAVLWLLFVAGAVAER